MVARVGVYYGTAFQGARGVMPVDLLSPTIFNVVVEALVRKWVTVLISDAEEQGERGKKGKHQYTIFYADNGMVSSSNPRWIHGAFNTLVVLFHRVGLKTNVGKTVGMVCRPC